MLRGGKRLNNNVSLFKTLEEVSGHGGEPPQMEKCIELQEGVWEKHRTLNMSWIREGIDAANIIDAAIICYY